MSETYEVQSFKGSRWMVEYRSNDKDDAISEAQSLYSSGHYKRIKVVREVFDQTANLYKETVVFKAPGAAGPSAGPIVGDAKPQKKAADASARPVPKAAKARSGKRSIFDFLKE